MDIQKYVNQLASQLHEDWRAGRRQEDGAFEPRVKTTKDQAWIEQHGASEVDIANTGYADLPSDWQAENKASAEVAVEQAAVIREGIAQGENLEELIEQASSVVHDQWLSRNGEWAPEEQKLPYDRLSEEEKAKDRIMVTAALDVIEHDLGPQLETGHTFDEQMGTDNPQPDLEQELPSH